MGEKDWAERFGAEWAYVVRLGKAISDPEEKKSFWESVKAKKEADPSYSIYTDFPTSKNPKNMAQKYCADILAMIRGAREEEE